MYSRCLFCNLPLGRNSAIEEIQIGRRVAFDQERGRLWVICPACARWNLTPIDERWEAIEACERAFRTTRVRASSPQIGLAQLPEGLELVRIGRPIPTEFAAWRYSRQFLARHRRRVVGIAGRAALLGIAPVLSVTLGPAAALGVAGLAGAAAFRLWRRPAAVIPLQRGRELRVALQQIHQAALIRDETVPDGWGLACDHLPFPREHITSLRSGPELPKRVVLTGPDARTAATLLLPHLNPIGGDPETVQEATRWLEAARGPDEAFRTIAGSAHVRPALRTQHLSLATLYDTVRLALEMAVHEEEERRHLAGEFSVLTWMWRRAEHLAAIADGLGLPEWVEGHVARLRAGRSDGLDLPASGSGAES
jgi:hypothetical protein